MQVRFICVNIQSVPLQKLKKNLLKNIQFIFTSKHGEKYNGIFLQGMLGKGTMSGTYTRGW